MYLCVNASHYYLGDVDSIDTDAFVQKIECNRQVISIPDLHAAVTKHNSSRNSNRKKEDKKKYVMIGIVW